MLVSQIESILNEQVKKEGYSSNLYLAMASWAESHGFAGVAEWLYAQADEERLHMLKFINFINDRGGHAAVPALDEPPKDYGSVLEVFEAVLKHEQYVTESINEIVAACIEAKDFTTQNWIQWFVTEQIEEEASVNTILDKLRLVGDSNMYLFDRDIMGMRGEAAADQA